MEKIATKQINGGHVARRSQQSNPEVLRRQLVSLLTDFESSLQQDDLRQKVLSLVPIHYTLRDLGSSLIPREIAASARDRILHYFLKYPFTVIAGAELMVVAGITDYPRRIRELRREFGWAIVSGETAKEYAEEEDGFPIPDVNPDEMGADDYILIDTVQDKEAALRWNIANEIRNSNAGVRDKILRFLQENVGSPVTGEELRYVAKDRSEWARRVRELRTELGWPIVTQNTGRPDLPVSVYVLEQNRQSPEHDRHIPDPVRREVLRRDGYQCRRCGWNYDEWNRSDPRHLELHHIEHHAAGGANSEANLISLCTVCHDNWHSRHTTGKRGEFEQWLSPKDMHS